MELHEYLRGVSEQLTAAAALGDDRTREVAATLAAAAQASVRVAILDALAAAAIEVTDALHAAGDAQPAPAVSLQLTGDQVRFTVTSPPRVEEAEPAASRPEDGDATARISFRLSDSLKADIERAAGQAGLSVNSWLVRAATNALRPGPGPAGGWHSSGGHRFTGWVTG